MSHSIAENTGSKATHTLVELNKVIPNIALDIRYATANNFTDEIIYPEARCFAQAATAEKLAKVQAELAEQGLGLKIFDCYRPLAAQYKLFEIMPDERYVANPKEGSKHNRGSAVDLTIIQLDSQEALAMPTEFDDFTEKAHHDYMSLSDEVLQNRALLRSLMVKHGFEVFPSEWWHYDDTDWRQYEILDIPFDQIG